jgi:ATP-dependent helicase HepA
MFNVGDRVCLVIDKSVVGVVVSIIPSAEAATRYQVFHDASNIAIYYEDQLLEIKDEQVTRAMPLEEFLGAYATKKMQTNAASTMFALNSGNIKFIPFQFKPLAKILKAEQPRLLIADEVGVGKTIETGIILKEFEKRDSVKSVMIVCPKDLTGKWRREMKMRFDEAFEVLSSDRLNYCFSELEMEGFWPYECRKCIVGLEMLRRAENIQRLVLMEDLASFDMLIVDEAHHVINPSSKSHQIVEYFCESSDVVVFLSATPLQLGSGDLFSLLNLLLPEEFMDIGVFSAMAEPNHFINAAIRHVRNITDEDWQKQASEELKQIFVNEWAQNAFSNNNLLSYWIKRLDDLSVPFTDEERISCLRDLESLHTFSHVINRTKRKDIGEFTIREPITILTQYDSTEQKFYDAVKDFKNTALTVRYGERTAKLIMSTIERQITSSLPAFVSLLDQFIDRGLLSVSEVSDDWGYDFDFEEIDFTDVDFHEWANHLQELAKELPEKDAKANQLLTIIDETVHNTEAGKLLVFSFFKHTLRYLHNIISASGIRVEIINGDTPIDVREDYRQRFRLPKEHPNAIDVLLSSEVGCEGLDYEFCSRLVNYDIPWNPMKIEQRIGRIDRFGQKSPKVQIYNFITEGTVEEKIFFRCYDRLGIFNSTIGDLEGVLGDVAIELTVTALDTSLSDEQQSIRTQQLIDNAIRMVDEQRQFEADSKELFLMDIEADESLVMTERRTQIQWQKHLIKNYLVSAYPDIICTEVSSSQLRLRIFKADKQSLLSTLSGMRRKRKVDRNSVQLAELENYLLSDNQTILLDFDSTNVENHESTLRISTTHPLISMALEYSVEIPDTFYTSCIISEPCALQQGKYLFACYEWKERGYRESTDIQVLLFDYERNQPITLMLPEFEKMLLSSKGTDDIPLPDLTPLEAYIYKQLQAAKERLLQVNQDVISRKLSSLNRYYSKQIGKAQDNFERAKNKKIRTMHHARIQKLEQAWKEKQDALKSRMQADVLVKLFASGIIEVR